MSLGERSGQRDLLYSLWHRPRGGELPLWEKKGSRQVPGIRRYLGPQRATHLKVVDIDWCEACHWCSEPLVLIETQRSGGPPKPARITVALAKLAGIPAYSVSFHESEEGGDIDWFRYRKLWPSDWECDLTVSPAEYAEWLWSFRRDHEPDCTVLRKVT